MSLKPIVGAVGGLDSSGAAGLAADIKAIAHLGAHVVPIATAVTAQMLTHVSDVQCVEASMIRAQLHGLMSLGQPGAVKIGMMGSELAVRVIVDHFRSTNCVLIVDPVLNATAGRALLEVDGIKALRDELMPLVTLLTPNIPEAERLTGERIHSRDDMRRAAYKLREMGPKAVVIKGGHGDGPYAADFVVDNQGEFWLSSMRHPKSVRGTGCVFASVVAATMAMGRELRDALVMAKAYLARGIALSQGVCEQAPRVLYHDRWPVRSDDFPRVSLQVASHRPGAAFPAIDPTSIGFYPIVPRASWVERLAELGVKTIQLRLKELPLDVVESEIAHANAVAMRFGTQLFINDYWELALKHKVFGVHLGQEDLLSADVDRLRASGIHLGISTHSYFEAAVAHGIRPSYVALGPIFPTTCKSMSFGPQGIERVGEWRAILPYPLVAIGGLRPEHGEGLRERGADGWAVISDWLYHSDPEMRVKEWLQKLA